MPSGGKDRHGSLLTGVCSLTANDRAHARERKKTQFFLSESTAYKTFVPGVHFGFFAPDFGQNFEKKTGNAHPLQYSSFSHENQRHCQLLLWLPRKPYVFSLVSALISRNKGKFLFFEKTVFSADKNARYLRTKYTFHTKLHVCAKGHFHLCMRTDQKKARPKRAQAVAKARQTAKTTQKSFFKER